MERRTILTALVTAPLAAFASTAHALGRRRRQCYDQPSDLAGEVPKGVDTPLLTLTPMTGMPGMTIYRVFIAVNVTAETIAGVIQETIMSVDARLVDSTGLVVPGFDYQLMTVDPDPSHSTPPSIHYILLKGSVMLTPARTYRAQVRATIMKNEFALSGPQTA